MYTLCDCYGQNSEGTTEVYYWAWHWGFEHVNCVSFHAIRTIVAYVISLCCNCQWRIQSNSKGAKPYDVTNSD